MIKQRLQRERKPARRQQGFSLVELMIALVLGLIVISAVINTYVGSNKSSTFSRGLQKMQENGRFGISTLQNGVRLAGYSTETELEPFDIPASGESRIVVRVQNDYDCNGVATAGNGGIATNTYEHDAASSTITCTGNASNSPTPMTIVDGVEAMRILWGIDTDRNDIPERYIPYESSIDADQVIGLRIAILVNSGEPIRTQPRKENYVLFDLEMPETNDRIARTVFSSTVMLRNRQRSL